MFGDAGQFDSTQPTCGSTSRWWTRHCPKCLGADAGKECFGVLHSSLGTELCLNKPHAQHGQGPLTFILSATFQISMNAGPSLRPAEATWCVWTKMAGICASPEPTQCIEGPTRTPTQTPTQVRTQQLPHRCQLQTTPQFRGLSCAALDSRWMKATSVWVSSPES